MLIAYVIDINVCLVRVVCLSVTMVTRIDCNEICIVKHTARMSIYKRRLIVRRIDRSKNQLRALVLEATGNTSLLVMW